MMLCMNPTSIVVGNYFKCEVISLFFPFQMLKCIELDEKLKSMDQEITVNPQFVQKVRQRLTASNT